MSSRVCPQSGCVAAQLSVDDVGQPPFQASHRFFVALAFGSFPQVIGPSRGVLPDLGKGHDVEAEVELAVAGAGEPMPDNISGGHVDRGGAGVGGERRRGAESIDGADPAEDLARGQGADAAQFGESGAGGGDRVWISAAALAMRRSSWRISVTRSTARPRRVLPATSRGRIPRRSSAARSAPMLDWLAGHHRERDLPICRTSTQATPQTFAAAASWAASAQLPLGSVCTPESIFQDQNTVCGLNMGQGANPNQDFGRERPQRRCAGGKPVFAGLPAIP